MSSKIRIPSAKPYFPEDNMTIIHDEIKRVLKSGRLILGPYTERLENGFKGYIGTDYAVAVSSCTAALEITMRYWNIKDKEVIIPTNTFIACPNSVIYAGGEPVFADINPENFCIGSEDILRNITPKTKVVMVVHLGGLPVPEIDKIKDICEDHNLLLLEDSSHAHGAMINGKKVGSLGDASCFSLYPTKVMTSCVGGLITTNDKGLFEFSKSVRHHGQGKDLDNITNFGNNWLMDEIRAIIGFHQLSRIDEIVTRRNQIAKKYMKGIDKLDGFDYVEVPAYIRHAYYKFLVMLDSGIDRDKILQNKEVEFGVLYSKPLHIQPIYKKIGEKYPCPNAERALSRQIALPMFVEIKEEDINLIMKSFQNLKEEVV